MIHPINSAALMATTSTAISITTTTTTKNCSMAIFEWSQLWVDELCMCSHIAYTHAKRRSSKTKWFSFNSHYYDYSKHKLYRYFPHLFALVITANVHMRAHTSHSTRLAMQFKRKFNSTLILCRRREVEKLWKF